jgi:anti-repressor protein
MNDLMTIKNVRGYSDDKTVFLNLEDVSRGLGFTQIKNDVEYVKWERVESYLKDLSFSPKVGKETYIPENIFYKLCFKANNETARAFQNLVCDEVLPTIRKTGGYVNNEEAFIGTYLPFADEQTKLLFSTTLKTVQSLNRKIEQDKPKVLFADAVATSKTSILIGDLAKILKQNGIEIGQKRLFGWLRDNGYLIKSGESRNMPTQKAMETKLFEVKETAIDKPNGTVLVTKTTKVTGKGQQYFVNKLLKEGLLNT